MKNKNIQLLTQAGLIAAIYVVLCIIFAPIGSGEVQVRIAEMLTILPFFTPAAVPGLFIGCLLANTLTGAVLPDIIFGSLATLVAAIITSRIGKSWREARQAANQSAPATGAASFEATAPANQGARTALNVPFGKLILATIPPILANALVVPFVLKYAYGVPLPIPVMMLTVGAGEVIGCGALGFFLGRLILRYRGRIRFS